MIENLGAIVHIYSSGMVQSDKDRRYPNTTAKIGDVMIRQNGEIRIVSKEEYKELISTPKKRKTKEQGEEENE